ncbi:MAG TPA: PAS domain-containing sensor histidine kinase, partial [Verrucomicrobiae bacterium]|nr:PAS domain-containing sensor histidine kinase [Verrucomicrobiae bacterium]
SSHGVVLHDENEVLEANPAAVRIMRRCSAQELVGKHPSEMAPPLQPNGESSVALARQYVAECMTMGSARFEWIASSPDGGEIPLEVTLTRIEWSGRQVIQALITDITERTRAQAALMESEARFSAAFRASPALIGILRISDGRYVLANEAYLNWLGYPQEEVLGCNCIELGLWENLADRDSVLNDMQIHGSIRQRECRWRNRHGQRFTILLSAETIRLNDTPHMIIMAIDITQRKRAEEELLKTLEREKELSQLKSSFVSMVSHEFRTPLGIIQSSGELLRDFSGKMDSTERNEQLQSIVRNTRRMAGMMEEVLVLSRLDAGKLDFEPATLDLNVFCRRVVDEVLSATSRRCSIELSLGSIPANAKADERLLGHIFTNLLSNAIKYSEPGAMVYFRVERDGAEVVCTVRDQGIGISSEDQQQLFKAFYRGGNVGTRPGTGLGLLLVKRCTELHEGNVELNSAVGAGTTVTVRLPVFSK